MFGDCGRREGMGKQKECEANAMHRSIDTYCSIVSQQPRNSTAQSYA